jgi:polyhydroxybutyrate depolymerase
MALFFYKSTFFTGLLLFVCLLLTPASEAYSWLTFKQGAYQRVALLEEGDTPKPVPKRIYPKGVKPPELEKPGRKSAIILLHGGGQSASTVWEQTTLPALAKSKQFVLAVPNAINGYWQDGSEPPNKLNTAVDDVAYLSALIDKLVSEHNVDKQRVFVAGVSNGGMMSFKLGCEVTGKLRGIAAVLATMPLESYQICRPSAPLSVLMIAGTADPLVPYEGGAKKLKPQSLLFKTLTPKPEPRLSVEDSLWFWARHNQCKPQPRVLDLPDLATGDGSTLTHWNYSGCTPGKLVQLYKMNGAGHRWPLWPQLGKPLTYNERFLDKVLGSANEDMDAGTAIWEFFSQTG